MLLPFGLLSQEQSHCLGVDPAELATLHVLDVVGLAQTLSLEVVSILVPGLLVAVLSHLVILIIRQADPAVRERLPVLLVHLLQPPVSVTRHLLLHGGGLLHQGGFLFLLRAEQVVDE